MKVYRSYKDCFYQDINFLYKPAMHVYGQGICFGLTQEVSENYGSDCSKFNYLIEYTFNESSLIEIDASKFNDTDDILLGCFYYLKLQIEPNPLYQELLVRAEEKLGYKIKDLDIMDITLLFDDRGFFEGQSKFFSRPDIDDYFEEYGYFMILNNKVLWSKKLEEIYSDSGIKVIGYNDSQIVVYNTSILNLKTDKIYLFLNEDLNDFKIQVQNKYSLESNDEEYLVIEPELIHQIDLELQMYLKNQ